MDPSQPPAVDPLAFQPPPPPAGAAGGTPGYPFPYGPYDGAYTRDWEYVPGAGDLDDYNGRFGVTPEFPEGTYSYVITEEFPFVPRLFRGEVDESFIQRRPSVGGRGGGDGGDPGRQRPGGGRYDRRPPRPPS